MVLKGMFGTLIGVVIGGEAIKQVGSISAFHTGLKSVTQIGIGLGVLGQATKPIKKLFKF